MEEFHTNSSEIQLSRKSEDNIANFYFSKHDSVKLRKNNVASKILSKSPPRLQHRVLIAYTMIARYQLRLHLPLQYHFQWTC